jgi:hypothetical protein
MKLNDLSNEEIVFIYMIMEDKIETLNEILDKGGITYVVDSPLGKIELFGKLNEKELQNIVESMKYKLANSIAEKLDPVYDLIAESNKNIIDDISESLFPKIDDDDEKD